MSAEKGGWLRPLLPVAACVFLLSAVAHVRMPLLPAIGSDLHMPTAQLGLAVALFGVGRLALDLPSGLLADKMAPMRLMALAALGMAAASTVPRFRR
jgi:predicted MFS family arabinose efflux permease